MQQERKDWSPQEDYNLTAAEAASRRGGLHVVVACPWVLQLDLDEGMSVNEDVASLLRDNGWITTERLTTTSQNGNQHVYIRTARWIDDLNRSGLQSMLGSDPKRETLSWMRLQRDPEGMDEGPATVLFETDEHYSRAKHFVNYCNTGEVKF